MDITHSFLRYRAPVARLLLAVVPALFAPAFAAWQPIDIDDDRALLSPPTISVRNGTLFFDGKISEGSAKALHRQLEMRRVEKVSFNSIGGDIQEAMAMGRDIHKRKLDVEVRNACAAACANYIFPAGKGKFLSQNAYLLWRGSLHSPAGEIAPDADSGTAAEQPIAAADFAELKEQEAQFFKEIGVNGEVAWCPQREENYRQTFPEKWFSWSPANLATFGITNIHFTTSAARWQQAMTAKGVIFADPCS